MPVGRVLRPDWQRVEPLLSGGRSVKAARQPPIPIPRDTEANRRGFIRSKLSAGVTDVGTADGSRNRYGRPPEPASSKDRARHLLRTPGRRDRMESRLEGISTILFTRGWFKEESPGCRVLWRASGDDEWSGCRFDEGSGRVGPPGFTVRPQFDFHGVIRPHARNVRASGPTASGSRVLGPPDRRRGRGPGDRGSLIGARPGSPRRSVRMSCRLLSM